MLNKPSVKKIILIVWVVFSIFYVAYSEYTRFKVFVMQGSYNKGIEDAVAKVLDESKNCKGFPINLGDKSVTLVNVECLKQAGQDKAPEVQK